jgi:hypothetical protein
MFDWISHKWVILPLSGKACCNLKYTCVWNVFICSFTADENLLMQNWFETSRCCIIIDLSVALEYTIRKIKENQEGLELYRTHQFLVCPVLVTVFTWIWCAPQFSKPWNQKNYLLAKIMCIGKKCTL